MYGPLILLDNKEGVQIMLSVLVPIVVLLVITLVKKIPFIGGKIQYGLLAAAFLSLFMGGVFNPVDWIMAFWDGIDRFTWILCLLPVAAVYAQTQIHVGSMSGVVRLLRSLFGNSQRGLIVATIVSLLFAGSLLGSSGSAAAIVGVLVVTALDECGIKAEKIAAMVVMGGALGSICPPVSTALYQASTIMGVEPGPVLGIGYITIILCAVFCCIYSAIFFVNKDVEKNEFAAFKKEHFSDVIKEVWKSLIPVCLLVVIIVLNNGFKIDVITFMFGPVFNVLNRIPLVKGLAKVLVATILFVTLISFLYPAVRSNTGTIVKTGLKNVKNILLILSCAACMTGAIYAGGQIDVIKEYALTLNSTALIFGGALCLMVVGMITGSDTVSLNTIFTFYGPALVAAGFDSIKVAAAAGHLAAAGQGMPPADMTTFVVVGLLGGLLGKKIDPLKVMLYSLPMCIFLFITGIIILFN